MIETGGHLLKGNYQEAVRVAQRCLPLIEKQCGKTCNQYVAVLGMMANSHAQLSQFELSRNAFEELIGIIEKQGQGTASNLLYVKSLGVLSSVYRQLGLFELAESHFEKTLNLLEKSVGKEDREYLTILSHLGNLYVNTNRPEQAATTYEHVLRTLEKKVGKKNSEYLFTLDNLAQLYANAFGQFARAEESFLEVNKLTIDVFGKESTEYRTSLTSLGQFYNLVGLFEQAEYFFLAALASPKVTTNVPGEKAFTQLTLANLYTDVRRYTSADSLFRIVEPVYKATYGPMNPRYTDVLLGLSKFYVRQQQHTEAEKYIRQSLQLLKSTSGTQTSGYATCLSELAKLYAESQQYEKADSAYRIVCSIIEKTVGKTHHSYTNALYCYAQVLTRFNKKAADSLFHECQQLKVASARQHEQFLSESEQTQLQPYSERFFDFLTDFYTTQPDSFRGSTSLILNTSLYLKGSLLESAEALRKRVVATGDTTLVGLLTRWQDQKRRLGYYEQHPDAARPVNLTDEREKANQLEKELIRKDGSFRRYQAANELTWTDVKQRLGTNEAAIEFIHFRHYRGFDPTDSVQYAALIIRPTVSEPQLILLTSGQKLMALLNRNNRRGGHLYAIRGSEVISRSKSTDGKILYQQIWKPLMASLNGVKTIHFSPSGLLHRISYAALLLPDGSRLIDHYDLHQLLSLRELVQPQPLTQAARRLVAFGGVAYRADSLAWTQAVNQFKINKSIKPSTPDKLVAYHRSLTRSNTHRPLAYLPGTLREIDAIQTSWGSRQVQLLTQYTASEEALKAFNGLMAPAIIHLATHGFFFPAPKASAKTTEFATGIDYLRAAEDPLLRSGLLLAGADRYWQGGLPMKDMEDGILTAYEIAQMDLSRTELVVLSACETGLGDIVGSEGVYGLQRAFKLAGVKRLIVSLWKVPDQETAEFMKTFYNAWQPGVPVRTAFRKAQHTLKKRFASDPYKWAAFTLVE